MSPAMNSSTEKPSRDGSLPSTLANRLKARDASQIAETAQVVKPAPEFQPDSGQFQKPRNNSSHTKQQKGERTRSKTNTEVMLE